MLIDRGMSSDHVASGVPVMGAHPRYTTAKLPRQTDNLHQRLNQSVPPPLQPHGFQQPPQLLRRWNVGVMRLNTGVDQKSVPATI